MGKKLSCKFLWFWSVRPLYILTFVHFGSLLLDVSHLLRKMILFMVTEQQSISDMTDKYQSCTKTRVVSMTKFPYIWYQRFCKNRLYYELTNATWSQLCNWCKSSWKNSRWSMRTVFTLANCSRQVRWPYRSCQVLNLGLGSLRKFIISIF